MSDQANRTFPAAMPSSTADRAVIHANDWAAFSGLERLQNHWELKAWPTGHRAYYWYLTFDDARLAALARKCQDFLSDDGLDPVPHDGLHITLLGIGDAAEVSGHRLNELVAAAEEQLAGFAPFELVVGPLAGSRSAVRFSVAPWDPLLELHRLLFDCTARFRPDLQPGPTHFRPHLGIGYLNAPRPAKDLVETVAALHALPPVQVDVDTVELVELRREGRAYRWDTRAAISLAD
ncbi:2'-5' RNA ligase family protein [Nocardia cyriacigeorgica]|uniref:2'-5' RNA ligase family protein n=1 Tax=Nocardia cyriacigeorgica TaxID=135487 RepID=UPI0034DB465D